MDFVKQVWVNVVANLIAAAILYLLGVITGLLPRSPAAFWVAVGLIVVLGALALYALIAVLQAANFVPKDTANRWLGSLICVAGVGFAVLSPFAVSTGSEPWGLTQKVAGVGLGVGMAMAGGLLLSVNRAKSRRASRSTETAHVKPRQK